MDFYRVRIEIGKRKRFAYGITIGNYPSIEIQCDKCKKVWKKSLYYDESQKQIIALSNNYFPDFLSYTPQILISQRAKEIFVQEKITGYHLNENLEIVPYDKLSIQEIKEIRRDGFDVKKFSNEVPKYYRFYSDGKAELNEKSNVLTDEHCDECSYTHYYTKGYSYFDTNSPFYITEKTWDGKDFFTVKEFPTLENCTERVVEIYNKYKMTGLYFEKIESI